MFGYNVENNDFICLLSLRKFTRQGFNLLNVKTISIIFPAFPNYSFNSKPERLTIRSVKAKSIECQLLKCSGSCPF